MENVEIWKDIKNYEGFYQVSSFGNVKSFKAQKNTKFKILHKVLNIHGYYQVALCDNKTVKKTFKIHQLVAVAFLNHIPCGMKLVINHINLNKLDNRVENLEIVTTRENCNMKHLKSSSNYTGVSWNKNKLQWSSVIGINGKVKHLGYFNSEIEASLFYENALFNHNNNLPIKTKETNFLSKHKGVSFDKKTNKWFSQITVNGKSKRIGSFTTEIEAAKAYNEKLIEKN